MSWLNRQIAKVFPAYALKREVARRRLDRLKDLKPRGRRNFDAISKNRLRYDFLSPKNSADAAIKDGIEGLRNHVRQLEYNNGFVSGPIQRIVNNVVGLGFQFQSRLKVDDNIHAQPFPSINEKIATIFNAQAERGFRLWAKKSDKRLVSSFNEQLRITEGAFLRDGEILVVGRTSKRRGRIIPYCVELLEADRLASPMEEINNPRIRNGIRYDDEGVPESYFILKDHPGDSLQAMTRRGQDFEEIPAFNPNDTRKVLHLYNPLRPEQSRGFSAFASALKDFQDLDRYREAEIYAALEDACLTGFVKTPAPEVWQGNVTVDNIEGEDGDDTTNRIHEFAPNKWHYLNPGEDVYIHAPSRPNDAFGEMTNQLLRGPANALDIPPEILSQNWRDMNYSNARTVLLMFYLSMRVRQNYLIQHFCVPVWENVLTELVIHGHVRAPGFDRRKEDYFSHAWIPPGWQWVDPVKEAKGKEIEVQNNFETLADLCASRGRDVDDTLEQRARELRKIKDLEEKYDVEFPKITKSNAGTAGEHDEKEEEGLRVIK